MLKDQSLFTVWLRHLLSEIRGVKGIVQKLTGKCPGKAAAFKHPQASGEQVLCEAAVLNALEKMNTISR